MRIAIKGKNGELDFVYHERPYTKAEEEEAFYQATAPVNLI